MKFSIQVKPDRWVVPFEKGFDKWTKSEFVYSPNKDLFPHQSFVKDYMQEAGPNMGIVLYHGLGVGKTRSAIAIAETSVGREIVVLLPASLVKNFEKEVAGLKGKKEYEYIGYDGLKKKSVSELESFDNKLVIIDEVHTFISRVMSKGIVGKEVYQKLMNATNCKIIALSGTPIINNPHELAYTLNLVHGYIYSHVFTPSAKCEQADFNAAEQEIKQHPLVKQAVTAQGRIMSITFWPRGFMKTGPAIESSSSDPIETIKAIYAKHNVKLVGKVGKTYATLFPALADEFETKYVNYREKSCTNEHLFSHQALGLVSYFESYDESSFPRTFEMEVIKVPMRKTQFGKYLTVRQDEIKKERNAQKYVGDDGSNLDKKDMGKGSVYRSFSRALCNFVFPDEINRPYPSTMKQFKSEVDEADDDYGGTTPAVAIAPLADKTAKYERQVAIALKKLREQADKYLSFDGLLEHGPKIKEIIERVTACPGSSLVYSSFRNVEGIKILSMAMDYAGYVELKVRKGTKGAWEFKCDDFKKPKYIIFTDKKDETKILMDLFNSDMASLPADLQKEAAKRFGPRQLNLYGEIAKVLMITQSGAQGISLKNVRQVHIMEPFWNEIRIKQVCGRAIRAMSHASLPLADRTVHTFLYVMDLVQKDQYEQSAIKTNDKGLSSDGYILDIARRKSVLNNKFLQLVKNCSVDCALNKKAHGTAVQCFNPSSVSNYVGFTYKGQTYTYLANPTNAQKAEFQEQSGKKSVTWTGLYQDNVQVGVARLENAKVKGLKVF